MKTKRILGIIIAIILFSMSVLIIVGSIIQKHYDFSFSTPQSIIVYKNGKYENNEDRIVINKSDERFDKIINLFETSFQTNYINALLKGVLNENVKTTEVSKSISSLLSSNKDSYFVRFEFGEIQQTMAYGDIQLSYGETNYNSAVFEISNQNQLARSIGYLFGSGSTYSNIAYSTYANYTNLYSYLSKNV